MTIAHDEAFTTFGARPRYAAPLHLDPFDADSWLLVSGNAGALELATRCRATP